MRTIGHEELKQMLDRKAPIRLVMALSDWAYQVKHIPGSIHFATTREALQSLGKEDEIVVYCSDKNCIASRALGQLLERNGYTHVLHFMATLREARVLATARPEAVSYVTSLGAAQSLDYTQGDLVTAVRTLHPGGIDAVLDVATTDPANLEHISQVLRAGGRLISTVQSAQASRLAEQGINAATLSWQPSAALLERIARLVDAEQLTVVIDITAILSRVNRAMLAKYLIERKNSCQ